MAADEEVRGAGRIAVMRLVAYRVYSLNNVRWGGWLRSFGVAVVP